MTLEQFMENVEPQDVSLVVVNRESPEPVQSMLEGLFDNQPVTVGEEYRPDEPADTVYLLKGGAVVASSPLAALQESILHVNSNLYMTGTRRATEVDLPDVLDRLEDVRFELRGYPESHREKLLLITISRYIERLALESEGGTHRASFQRLSLINDEKGTRYVYEQLADSAVDTHVYGMPDWCPSPEFDVTMHGGWFGEFRDSWFVTFEPDDVEHPHAALVALEQRPRLWSGFWTYDSDRVTEITRYIERCV